MNNGNIYIRQGRPDEAERIAELIIMAMTEECCLHFCGPEHDIHDFHRVMSSLVARPDTQYSYSNTLVAMKDEDAPVPSAPVPGVSAPGRILGICVSYDGALLHQLRQPFIDTALKEWNMDHSSIPDETQAGELYLDSLAVDPAYRGRGIAKLLLQASIEKSRALGLPSTGLLVDVGNPKAELLYNKVGFQYAGTNSWGGHDMKHL
ncbi:MAG: GNAT family N-acetyltransferase, partial [Prevotella sp.]